MQRLKLFGSRRFCCTLLLISLYLPLCAQLTRYRPSNSVLCKTSFGTYGYKRAGDDSWRLVPRYKYAERLPYVESCGAFSVDGKKYGIINSFEFVLAMPIFDRPPHDISYGLAIIDTDQGQHITNYNGDQLTPNVYKILRYETTFAIKWSQKDNWQFVDANFHPYSANAYKSISVGTLSCDSLQACYASTQTNSGMQGMTDFQGNSLLSGLYKEIIPLSKVYQSNYNFREEVDKLKMSVDYLQPFALVQNLDGKFSLIDYQTESMIPVKGKDEWGAYKNLKKIFKQQIAPLCTNEKRMAYREMLVKLNQSTDSLTAINVAALGGKDYFDCISHYKLGYIEVKEVTTKSSNSKKSKAKSTGKKLYKFIDNQQTVNDPRRFTKLESVGSVYIGTEQGTKGVSIYDWQGFKLGGGKSYDAIETWAYIDDIQWFKFKENGKWGIMTVDGDVKLDPNYDEIDNDGDVMSKAIADGKLYLINSSTGHLVNNNAYDTDAFSMSDKYANVRRKGYDVKVYLNGREDPSVAKIAFKNLMAELNSSSNSMSDMAKLQRYREILQLCSTGDNTIAGACYNNIGVIYSNSGDTDTAKQMYIKGKSYGDKTAASNLAGIEANEQAARKEQRSSALRQIFQGIGTVLNAVTGNADYGSSGYDTDYSTGSSASIGNSGGGGTSEATYRSIYSRWEEKAKSAYESLTRAGTRSSKNGKATSGTSGGYWNSQNYTSLKKNLRYAQNEMRKTRQEARQKGINIPQSNYETVSVSY